MFDAATWMGLVLMLVIGPAVGNYACSVVYRLPLGRTPFERHPFCGHCDADLKPIDLAPILSWLSTRGKCRYCGGPIPAIYTVIELACLLLFCGYFLTFGIGESFLLLAAYGTFVIILAAIEWQRDWLSSSIYGYALGFAALHSAMLEGSVMLFLKQCVIVLVLGLLVERLASAIRRRAFTPFAAHWVWWLVLLVVAVPFDMQQLPLLVLLASPFAFRRTRYSAPLFAMLALVLPALEVL